jgi:hypothetical protein
MLERIKCIFYRPDFFRDQRFGTNQALSFYSFLMLAYVILTLFTLLPGASAIIQSMRSGEWQTQKGIVAALYPENLKLTVSQGTVSTNEAGPSVIAVPSAWKLAAHPEPAFPIDNLVVIDTSRPVTPATLEDAKTVVQIGQHEIGFRNPERGETRIFNLKEAKFDRSFTLTAPMFREGIERGFKALQIGFFVLLFVVPAVMYVGLWIGYLIYSLFGALVVWVVANVRGQTLRYGQAYRSALYLLAGPLALSFVMTLAGIHIPFVFTLALFGMAFVNFPKVEKLPDPVKIAATDIPVTPKDAEVEEKPGEEKK